MKKLMRFLKEENGATAVEYAIIASAIAAIIIITVGVLGDKVLNAFDDVNGKMS
jgi:pilus assembly protein Flp/PilA